MAKNPQVKVKTFRTPKKTKERNEKWKKVKVIFCFFLENLQWKYFHFLRFRFRLEMKS